jgi:anionic cell wall polymer biosynthesis LytR-Cps2A-Psr (LCP) family protein
MYKQFFDLVDQIGKIVVRVALLLCKYDAHISEDCETIARQHPHGERRIAYVRQQKHKADDDVEQTQCDRNHRKPINGLLKWMNVKTRILFKHFINL